MPGSPGNKGAEEIWEDIRLIKSWIKKESLALAEELDEIAYRIDLLGSKIEKILSEAESDKTKDTSP